MLADINVGVIGTGFMGVAHVEALRRLGLNVIGVVGSSPERARVKAVAANLPRVYDSINALLAEPALHAVHITSPNDVHADQVRAALAAGKHVVCEKPLALSSAETADLVARAQATGLVNAVCFNNRFYPQSRNAAALVRDGAIGRPRFVTGSYHQDWLLLETDWNWRLVAERQGTLRAVADIGSHWLDLVTFVSDRRIESVCADLHTFISERNHPVVEVETFAAATVDADVERVRERMESDDAAGILLRFEGGAGGVCSVSQVSAGRKNAIAWELDGSTAALWWASETPESLWIGHRGRPNELVSKDPSLMTAAGAATAGYPAAHIEGFPDTFRAMFAALYHDVVAGGPATDPAYATFADGHDAVLVTEAIACSAREGRWTNVRR